MSLATTERTTDPATPSNVSGLCQEYERVSKCRDSLQHIPIGSPDMGSVSLKTSPRRAFLGH